MGIVVIAVLVPLVSLLVTVGVVAWCMYRKRKCKRRETKGECFAFLASLNDLFVKGNPQMSSAQMIES